MGFFADRLLTVEKTSREKSLRGWKRALRPLVDTTRQFRPWCFRCCCSLEADPQRPNIHSTWERRLELPVCAETKEKETHFSRRQHTGILKTTSTQGVLSWSSSCADKIIALRQLGLWRPLPVVDDGSFEIKCTIPDKIIKWQLFVSELITVMTLNSGTFS